MTKARRNLTMQKGYQHYQQPQDDNENREPGKALGLNGEHGEGVFYRNAFQRKQLTKRSRNEAASFFLVRDVTAKNATLTFFSKPGFAT